MKKIIAFVVVLVFAVVMFGLEVTAKGAESSGAALFAANCSPCHANGGNIVNPQKTLHKKDLDANNVKKPGDIVKKMRNPGPGMTMFDAKTISDADAEKIAEYILKTFK